MNEFEQQTKANLGYEPYTHPVNVLNGSEATNYNNQLFASIEAEKARVSNSVEAQKNRDWETMMSNTAYQRAVADMKAAGINPASLGGDGHLAPASSPSGYAASTSPASAGAVSGGAGFLGMIGGIAKAAISMALFKKFSNSARVASTAASAVGKVGAEANSAMHSAKAIMPSLEEISRELENRHKKEAMERHARFHPDQDVTFNL